MTPHERKLALDQFDAIQRGLANFKKVTKLDTSDAEDAMKNLFMDLQNSDPFTKIWSVEEVAKKAGAQVEEKDGTVYINFGGNG